MNRIRAWVFHKPSQEEYLDYAIRCFQVANTENDGYHKQQAERQSWIWLMWRAGMLNWRQK